MTVRACLALFARNPLAQPGYAPKYMEYALYGLPHKSGSRTFLRLISVDESRELLKSGDARPVYGKKSPGRADHFVKTTPPPSGMDRPKTPQCEHVVDRVRHLKGVSFYPSWNIVREMRVGAYAR